jgi:hypothetical protein
VYKVLRDIEILSRHTPAEMGEALNGRLLWIGRKRTGETFAKV